VNISSVVANRSLVYLQYVDTTGCFVPRESQKSVTQALVLGYLGFCEAAGFLRCHIFAKANPHYLFRDSERNPDKKSLSDSQLINWWARTLSLRKTMRTTSPSSLLPKSWFLVLGEDDKSQRVTRFPSFLPFLSFFLSFFLSLLCFT
jgi:hypothetical protein